MEHLWNDVGTVVDIYLIVIVKVPIFDNIIIYGHMFNVYTNKHVCILTIQTSFVFALWVETIKDCLF